MDDIQALVEGLARLDDVHEVWATADRHLAAGDAAFVADLGIALWQRYGHQQTPPWQYRSVIDHVLRQLTLTPGVLDQALRFMAVAVNRRRTRYAASLLASAHSAADLEAVFGGAASEELRACLVHEIALRGGVVRHRWATSPHWRHHPLAWLPPSLTPMEGKPGMPAYTVRGGSRSLPEVTVEPAYGHGPVPAARETTTDADATAIATAVANWAEESNGRIEARTFVLDSDLAPEAVGDTLLSLGLESFRDPGPGFGPCSASQAWGSLFSAASTGGAYGWGGHGAYGRLFAWRSVAALAGAPPEATAAEVQAVALSCSWHSYGGAGDWFEQVAWDVGLAVVSPDRRRLAILAATDTD